jgi:hypothetical protein
MSLWPAPTSAKPPLDVLGAVGDITQPGSSGPGSPGGSPPTSSVSSIPASRNSVRNRSRFARTLPSIRSWDSDRPKLVLVGSEPWIPHCPKNVDWSSCGPRRVLPPRGVRLSGAGCALADVLCSWDSGHTELLALGSEPRGSHCPKNVDWSTALFDECCRPRDTAPTVVLVSRRADSIRRATVLQARLPLPTTTPSGAYVRRGT